MERGASPAYRALVRHESLGHPSGGVAARSHTSPGPVDVRSPARAWSLVTSSSSFYSLSSSCSPVPALDRDLPNLYSSKSRVSTTTKKVMSYIHSLLLEVVSTAVDTSMLEVMLLY